MSKQQYTPDRTWKNFLTMFRSKNNSPVVLSCKACPNGVSPRFQRYSYGNTAQPARIKRALPERMICCGKLFYFISRSALNQAARQGLSARIRFASANMILNLAVCFRRPRYRVFLNFKRPFTTLKTCSTLARTDDFWCSRFLALY